MKILRKILPILLVLILLVMSILTIRHELREYSFQDIFNSFITIPKYRKLQALMITALGYLAMTGYDGLAFCYIQRFLAPSKIIFTSFLSYAIGNTIGFTLFSGTAIRYRLYSPYGLSTIDLAKLIAFTHLSFWLGMFAIGGIVFIVDPLTIPDLLTLPFDSLHLIGIIFLSIVITYLGISFWRKTPIRLFGESFTIPKPELSLGLIIISAIDWALASAVLYLLFPANMDLSYPSFFGIYVLGLTAGIISTVPGGLGVFETVILFLCSPKVSQPAILGALLAYRGIYYFLPLIVAFILLIIYEVRQKSSKA